MPQALSAEQIQKTEQMVQARMASDPAFSDKVRSGKIKFIVVPGDKVSGIDIVDMTNPDNVQKYGGMKMYNTPQEAEHFTEGFGKQPTRQGGITDILESRTLPRYQHQRHDPIRKFTKDPVNDAVQDVLSTARYALPFIKNWSPAKVAGIAIGAGATGKAMSEAMGEEELQETWPNILATAATAGLSRAGNKYFSEDETQRRQLTRRVESQLGYGNPDKKNKFFRPSPLEPELIPEIEKTLKGGNSYTYDMWREAPLDRFYEKVGTRALPMTIDRLPMIHEPTSKVDPITKRYGTSAKIAPKNKRFNWNAQQWDAVSRRFIEEAGLPSYTDPNDVRAFIEEAWGRPDSRLGRIFYAKGFTPENFTTEQWAKLRKDLNPVVKELSAEKGKVIDENWDKQRAEALGERRKRFNRMEKKHTADIVTPQQYEKFGRIGLRLPLLEFGTEKRYLPLRPVLRGAATVAPIAAQMVLPYGIKWWNNRRGDNE